MITNESPNQVKNTPKAAPVKPPKKKEEGKSSNKWIAFLITTLIALGGAGYLFYENMEVKTAIEKAKAEKDAILLEKTKLLNDLDEKEKELRAQIGESRQKDSLITIYLTEIDDQRNKIRGLKSDRNALISLRNEKKKLQARVQQQEFTIDSLNRMLIALNAQLVSSDSMSDFYKERIAQLEAANGDLNKKVEMGSQLRVESAELTPQRKGSKGKFELSKSIKKANRLMLTFEIGENKIASAGERTFYVRISDPKGKLLENNESGTFQNADHNLSFPYTKMTTVNFSNSSQKVEMPVEIPVKQVYPAGNYNMEFYCDGYLCGVKKVALK